MKIICSSKTLNAILESSFIQNILFEGAPYSTNYHSIISSNNVIIYLELYDINLELIKNIKRAGKKMVLYHMGDELANKNIAAYADCDLIIRNYFFFDIFTNPDLRNKILWAPNGYKTGVGPRSPGALQKSSQRQNLSCFLGWLSNTASFNGERALFSEVTSAWASTKKRRSKNVALWLKHYLSLSKEYLTFSKKVPSCKENIYLLSSKGFSHGYNVGLYSATMEDSIFSPCPAGNSPETIRLYDALECGCIPITLNHEFITSKEALGAIGQPPFPILSTWDELPEFLEQKKIALASNSSEIEALQRDCITWWQDYKKYIGQSIAKKLAELDR